MKKYNHSNYDSFEKPFRFPFLFWQCWIIDRFSHWSGATEQVHWGKWVIATFRRNKRKLYLWLSCAVHMGKSFTLILISINDEMFEISSLEVWLFFPLPSVPDESFISGYKRLPLVLLTLSLWDMGILLFKTDHSLNLKVATKLPR